MKAMINQYIETHRQRFLDEVFAFLKIPSVSADSSKKKEMMSAARFLQTQLQTIGFEVAEVIETKGHPIVYGEWIVDEQAPTVLVYGHYDVQPADPLELWDTPPFEPVIKNEKIYARGASDDKGQIYMHLKALEVLQNTGNRRCNVKFLIEGEEEVGSSQLEVFIKENKEKLKSDFVLISDTAILSNSKPSLTQGLRGISYLQVELTGPNRDLHSGLYGGGIGNPINILCRMIGDLIDEEGKITIPGFYDDVLAIADEEREEMKRIPFDEHEFCESIGVSHASGEAGYTLLERLTTRPTLDVNGIWGGYTGEGSKTVLPSKAYAKVSMRLVPDQDPHKITELISKHLKAIAPKTVSVKISPDHGADPVVTPTDFPGYIAACEAMSDAFGKNPVSVRGGGSIPIVSVFKKHLGLHSVLMGFGLDTDAIHSPNEHYGVFNYFKGIETICLFYAYLKKQF